MNVWRPAAVLFALNRRARMFDLGNALAHFQANERIFREMPVEREEFLAIAGFMPQDDQQAVVLRSGIIRYDVDHAIQRRSEPDAPGSTNSPCPGELCAVRPWDCRSRPNSGEV